MATPRTIPVATLALVGATLVVYVAQLAAGGTVICDEFGFVPNRFIRTGGIVPVLVYPLLHDPSSLVHLVGNLALLVFAGRLVEPHLGAGRMLGVYVAGGIAGAFGHLLVSPGGEGPLVGSSGSVFALLAIAAVVNPRTLVFVGLLFAVNLVALFHPSPLLVSANTSIGCHVGGFVFGSAATMLARARGVCWATR